MKTRYATEINHTGFKTRYATQITGFTGFIK